MRPNETCPARTSSLFVTWMPPASASVVSAPLFFVMFPIATTVPGAVFERRQSLHDVMSGSVMPSFRVMILPLAHEIAPPLGGSAPACESMSVDPPIIETPPSNEFVVHVSRNVSPYCTCRPPGPEIGPEMTIAWFSFVP